MTVTVRKVMELEAFSQTATLVAGHGGMNNKISFVTVSEVPDFYEWVTGGELVLTTLYAFKDRQDLLVLNYRELAKRGVSAFGVKVNRFFEAIPDDIIEIANTYNVPLFKIKRETKFREIIQAISAEINNLQTNLLIEVEKHYSELAKIALVSGDFSDYIRGLARRKGCSVYCFQGDLKLLGSCQYSSFGNAAQVNQEKLEQVLLSQGEIIQPIYYDGQHIFPCVTRGQVIGYLIVADEEPLSEKHTLMAAQLTTFLTMKLMDQLAIEQKMLTSLLDELLYKRSLSEEELRERLALHGLKRQNRYRVIAVQRRDASDSSCSGRKMKTYCNTIKAMLGEAIVIATNDETIIIGANEQPDDSNPPRWLKNIGNDTSADDFPLIIGIGPSVCNAKDIQSSYQIAKSTLKAGLVFGNRGILYYGHYLARLILLRSVGTQEQERLLLTIIKPLVDQDERHNTQILPTIEAAMFADDLEQAAATLFVHANTIRYRLNKIKSITGIDFFTARGRYVITTAYLAYCYNK